MDTTKKIFGGKRELKFHASKRTLYFRTSDGEQFRSSNLTFHKGGEVSILRANGRKQRFSEGTFYVDAHDLSSLPVVND